MRRLWACTALFICLLLSMLPLMLPIPAANAQRVMTATPAQPPLQIVRIYRGVPPDALRSIPIVSTASRNRLTCSIVAGYNTNAWTALSGHQPTTYYSGAQLTVDPSDIPYLEAQPTLCTRTANAASRAFATGPDGTSYVPWVINADPNVYLIALPLIAYTRPGLWRLGTSDPNYFEVGIQIMPPSKPFFLGGSYNIGLIGGFSAFEAVKGILLDYHANTSSLDYLAEFDLTTDASGYAIFTLPELPTERLEKNYLLFVGKNRHAVASDSLSLTLQLNNRRLADFVEPAYTAYWNPPVVVQLPTVVPTFLPTAQAATSRGTAPAGSTRLGEFQVEQYCNNQGYGVILTNNQSDWACTNQNGSIAFTLSAFDFDVICQQRYANPSAFAIRDQQRDIRAYNWSCYAYTRRIPPPGARDVPPPGSMRLGEFQVEQYCNSRGYGVILVNNQSDWACTNKDGSIAFILGVFDFDAICQQRYNDPAAFVIRDQRREVLAYNWSCYAYRFAEG